MPTPIVLDLSDALIARLKQAPAVAQGRVYDSIPAEAADAHSSVLVSLLSAAAERPVIDGAPIDWDVTIAVACRHRHGVGNVKPSRGATLLMQQVMERVLADPTLGGIAGGIEPGAAQWSFEDDDRQTAVVTATFRALYRAPSNSL